MSVPPGRGDLLPRHDDEDDDIDTGLPDDPALPNVVQHADEGQLQHFVTTIKSAEAQIGEHIINALRADNCVAVLTTIVVDSTGRQNIVSAALDPDRMLMVQEALGEAEKERDKEVPCVGFHCYVRPKGENGTPALAKPETPDAPDAPQAPAPPSSQDAP
jgi:hypothetical protein